MGSRTLRLDQRDVEQRIGDLDKDAVTLMINQGMQVATQYRPHFKVSAFANEEIKDLLQDAQSKISGLTELDASKYAKEINGLQAEGEQEKHKKTVFFAKLEKT